MIQTFFFCNIYGQSAKLMGEEACEVQKRYLRKKLHAHHDNPNIYSCTGPKKNSHKGSVNEKNSIPTCGLKIPHPTPA